MADSIAQFFEALAARGHEPLLAKTTGTLRFNLRDGKSTERWHVVVAKGDLSVSRKNAGADCVLSMDRTLFEALASGRRNAVAAVLREEIEVEGDVRVLVAFQRLLPGPPRSRRRRPRSASARRKR